MNAAELLKGTTPGPWVADVPLAGSDASIYQGTHHDAFEICRVYGMHGLPNSAVAIQCRANSALIAAAPALAARVVELEKALRLAKPIVGAAVAASSNESRAMREKVYNRIVDALAEKPTLARSA